MQEKYGFIYLWRDKKHDRFYVGSHWGNENDGYVCSSSWMLQAYKKRPQDFKRRIVERFDDRSKINEIEHRWLQMIKTEELKKRYYNLTNRRFGHWANDERSRMTVGQKIALAKSYISEETRNKMRLAALGKKRIFSEEHKKNISLSARGKKKKKTGPRSEEVKLKISLAQLGKKRRPYSDERKRKISERLRREWSDGTRKRKHVDEIK